MQTQILDPAPWVSRNVVMATNITETSLTIAGIYNMVDPGFLKQMVYDYKMGMDQLVVTPISQAQEKQRAGRAGCKGPGRYYQLYTEHACHDEMLASNVPEIQRTDLASTVLSLTAMSVNDLLSFDFMDAPPVETLLTAMDQLYALRALDDKGLLTRLGRRMAQFPLEPMLCKMLIMSVRLGCSEEMLTIVSMLSVQSVFYRPKDKQALADQKKAKFHQAQGDHLTLLAVYNSWENNGFSQAWCYDHFLQARSLRRARDVRKQMLGIMDRHKLDVVSCGEATVRVQKAICSGFFRNAARKDPQEGYRTLLGQRGVYLHPSGALFHRQPEWVVYHELVLTTKEYMREVTTVDPRWLAELAPAFFKVSDPAKLSQQKQRQRLEPLRREAGGHRPEAGSREPGVGARSRKQKADQHSAAMPSPLEELAKLEYLSLVSKFSRSCTTTWGINDKYLAEFVISLAEKNTTLNAFKAALVKSGAEFTDSLVHNLLHLIQSMRTPAMPSKSRDPMLKPKSTKENRKELFLGQCGPDNPAAAAASSSSETMLDEDDVNVTVDALRELEGMMPSATAGQGQDRLEELRKRWEGLVHISELRCEARVANVTELDNRLESKHLLTAISDLEKWEIKQMTVANILFREEFPDFNEETGILPQLDGGEDEDLEIQLVDKEPSFLQGRMKHSSGDTNPTVKMGKNPDGSLWLAAMMQSVLDNEQWELKQAQLWEANLDSIPMGLHKHWVDPLPDAQGRQIMAKLRAIGVRPSHIPELKRQVFRGHQLSSGKTQLSILEQREGLPIYRLKGQLLQAFNDTQVLIIIGQTGSGKTTQITQDLPEVVAERVAEEFVCHLGQEVGYTVRFEDCSGPQTCIKYMTDGMLLRECLADPDLMQYAVIMLDQAQEGTIHTDVLFGLLKETVQKRRDMKLIITSSTLDMVKLSQYFFKAPIFTVLGRMYRVEILYTKEPETDYLDASLITAMQIHLTEPPGDMLVFLTRQEEIYMDCEIVYERMKTLGPDVPELNILPMYSALPSAMQTRIFDPALPCSRNFVMANNIGETSLTIDSIHDVVDHGFVKQRVYDSKSGVDQLWVTHISQAQAKQRAGRAGHTGPRRCYWLYTEHTYRDEMLGTKVTQIQRNDLTSTVLSLRDMGVNDLLSFNFTVAPAVENLLTAMDLLYALGLLDDQGLLTRLGRRMAQILLEPMLCKMHIMSVCLGCSKEMLTIVSMLSGQSIF
ncbi:ATP-dependent RNA helicase DHX8 [Fukomys damarensis]|uniref:RNA helicase n=1 Tax=Fukomys damarensis TaxID=885580 RepID=A0A091D1X3_FUKDA|nr:ATP-dependent RNA helicase DHX8 [Fukomys damarensis]